MNNKTWRLGLVMAFLASGALALMGRVGYLQVVKHGDYVEQAQEEPNGDGLEREGLEEGSPAERLTRRTEDHEALLHGLRDLVIGNGGRVAAGEAGGAPAGLVALADGA